jgi:hypothetical protein
VEMAVRVEVRRAHPVLARALDLRDELGLDRAALLGPAGGRTCPVCRAACRPGPRAAGSRGSAR